MEVLAQGIGAIFTDPDADKARAFFRKKSRALKPKVMSVKEAVEKFVHDGDYLCIGGFGGNSDRSTGGPVCQNHRLSPLARSSRVSAG